MGYRGVVYTPQKTKNYEATIRLYARKALQKHLGWDSNVPMWLELVFYRDSNRRVDIDNLTKSLLDGINNSGVWEDDSQIVKLSACKLVDKVNPRVTVVISPVTGTLLGEADEK